MTKIMRVLMMGGFLAAGLVVDLGPTGITLEPRVASAVVGRPVTPVSYAGVARRTVRRTARRTSTDPAQSPNRWLTMGHSTHGQPIAPNAAGTSELVDRVATDSD